MQPGVGIARVDHTPVTGIDHHRRIGRGLRTLRKGCEDAKEGENQHATKSTPPLSEGFDHCHVCLSAAGFPVWPQLLLTRR
jgi:hypothetical protein